VQSDGDPSRYPKIRMARFLFALQWLPRDLRADYGLRQQWIDNNMTYLDALVLALLQDKDSDYMKDTWPEYHYKHMCRLCVCPQYLWTIDMCMAFQPPTRLSISIAAPSATIPSFRTHSFTRPAPFSSIAEATAQFLVRDPNVERVGPCIPPRHPLDCWHNPERTPAGRPTNIQYTTNSHAGVHPLARCACSSTDRS